MAPITSLQKTRAVRRKYAGYFAAAVMLVAPNWVSTAHAQPRFIDPVQIDRSVENFTGQPAGSIGGARSPADPRLRLALCGNPLNVTWHGNLKNTVRVACEGRSPWHIFMAVRAAPKSVKAAKIIQRGDSVTIAVEGRGFTVRRPGEAQQAGAIGDWIAVKTSRKAKPVSAKIVRPGLVVIPLS